MPSADRRTSSSTPSAPDAMPRSNAARVFSGPSAQPPRWANTSGVELSKNPIDLGPTDRLTAMGTSSSIATLGELRRAVSAGAVRHRSVHQEVRENLIAKLRTGGPLFPGIVGYDDTVI